MDWDNIRIFLAIVRQGSLPAAAQALKINHTTVFRRLHELEESLETKLFQRSGRKLTLTTAGETLRQHAEAMEAAAIGINRSVAGIDGSLQGPLVITTTDTIAQTILPAILTRLARTFSGLQISVKCGNMLANLGKREADIAIRPTVSPPDEYVGRKLGSITFAYFMAESLRDQLKLASLNFEALRTRTTLIAYDDSLKHLGAAQELEGLVKTWSRVLRVDSLMTARAFCEQGYGIALLPRFLQNPRELIELPHELHRSDLGNLWLLSHRDIMKSARVAEAFRFLFQELAPLFRKE